MAYFTTSATIDAMLLGYEFSGTGPFWVADEDLKVIYAELTAGGATVTRRNVLEFPVLANTTVFDMPLWRPETQVVIDAVYFIPHSNIVGATDNYSTYTLETYNTGGTLAGTVAAYSNTAGTWTAFTQNTITASTVASAATVAAGYTLNLEKATAGSGLTNTASLLQIHYHVV